MLEGRVAVVSGAGSGIGRAEAIELARLGARVVVNDLSPASDGGGRAGAAEEVAEEIRAFGGEAVANRGDVSDWTDAMAMIGQAIDTFGGLDILINNAGISRPAMSFNMTETEWDDVVRVHLKGTFAPTRFAAAYWRDRAKSTGRPVHAAIVNTSSGNGLNGGTPGHVNYSVAKTGINTMTTALAVELAPYGVRCNAVAPLAYTRMTESLWGSELFPTDRLPELEPANVAAVVGWLASPASEGVTGKVLAVSGSRCTLWQGWQPVAEVTTDGVWTFDGVVAAVPALFDRVDPGPEQEAGTSGGSPDRAGA